MSLLPESASFEEQVQDYFLAIRGSGLMLSALDAALLSEWSAQGVPVEVVARGIARAAEKALWDARPGEPILRSLRSCRRPVEAEIRRYLTASAGQGAAAPLEQTSRWEEKRHRKLCESLRALSAVAPNLVGRVERLLCSGLATPPPSSEAADVQETWAYLALLRALPFSERLRLWREARGHGADGSGLSSRSRVRARRFRLLTFLRRRFSAERFQLASD